MPSIDGYSYITLSGRPQPLGPMVNEVTQPGANGHSFRREGRRAQRFRMRGERDVQTAADAESMIVALKNRQGSLVTVVDESGLSYSNVMLHSVTETDRIRIGSGIGGIVTNPGWLVTHEFELQLTQ